MSLKNQGNSIYQKLKQIFWPYTGGRSKDTLAIKSRVMIGTKVSSRRPEVICVEITASSQFKCTSTSQGD